MASAPHSRRDGFGRVLVFAVMDGSTLSTFGCSPPEFSVHPTAFSSFTTKVVRTKKSYELGVHPGNIAYGECVKAMHTTLNAREAVVGERALASHAHVQLSAPRVAGSRFTFNAPRAPSRSCSPTIDMLVIRKTLFMAWRLITPLRSERC